MFQKFTKDICTQLKQQHNIFVLVGNGFDISILKKLKRGIMSGKTTSYSDFYDYIHYFNLSCKDNILYQRMTKDKTDKKENWSDFENSIKELFEEKTLNAKYIEQLEQAIDEFQCFFSKFLNDLVDTDILLTLNEEVRKKQLSIQSLSEFLKDLSTLNNLEFIKNLGHYDLYNFVFANFNYTSLLDNYIYLDKLQFDPHQYKVSDRNFWLRYKEQETRTETKYSSYVNAEVIHPHGVQDIPRSILFGIDLGEYDKSKNLEKRLVKGYWSQYEVKYKSFIGEAELFIIYRMSLDMTDAWWMDAIYGSLNSNEKRKAELIIYWFGKDDPELIKDKFIRCCIRHANSSNEQKMHVKERIHVVLFTSNDTFFLGLKKK
ncbi:bacteriophage abortive infection protein AbiH [Lachnoanaerobaculum saburreum F0468]|mgnify:CR=1 FL=1|uniref:Bacteriophage abortive infection protein AbiH n=1 Tax=Lachnoanaerobaculum saburreum F0468 TaxID=1095750 RepID=I0R608_9FIRM|nr:AbiH family protein [Lachnoanaerobaculum saburreum]EIC95116.1 bacteriophage abortive infection protein AbiH [Lachnoanaerobaculum saburreum F0468]